MRRRLSISIRERSAVSAITAGGIDTIDRIAGNLAGLSGWRRVAAALLLGCSAIAALPPFHALPLLVVAFTGLLWLLSGSGAGRRAFWDGWWFGLGFHVPGLYWIANALLVEGTRFLWMVPLSLLALPAVLAIFSGAASWLARRVADRGIAGPLALAACWTLAEYLRGIMFTGFPWNLIGYAWTASDAMLQSTAVTGIYGLSLLTVALAAMPALLAGPARALMAIAGAALVLVGLWAGGALRLALVERANVPDVVLRIVQAGIAQHHKWDPELRAAHMRRHLELSAAPGAERITHVIWPETAVPYFLTEEPVVRAALAQIVPTGGLAIVGAPRIERLPGNEIRLWNSLHVVDSAGAIVATYDKAHLVPFGEYVPLRRFLPIEKITYGAVDFSAGPGPTALIVPGLPALGALICYEVIFPGEVVGSGQRPRWLVNLTNDAWYGTSTGPYQHFAMAQVRAVEEGLPMVRAANTGISGVIDGYGRVVARLGLNKAGVVDVPLPAALPSPTYYAAIGNSPVIGICLAVIGGIRLRRRLRINN